MKRYAGIALSIFVIQLALTGSFALASEDYSRPFLNTADWNSDESNFFIIYYHPTADLETIKKNITARKLYFDQPARYGEITVSQEIRYRLDKLFNQAEEMLSMYPKMPKIKIVIFKDRNELNREYFKIFGSEGDFKAYYVNKYETIYTSESDIEDSVLIHEIVHAIIDHYFSAAPPKIVGEVLASYVDAYFEK